MKTTEVWIENKGRRPCGENDRRHIRYQNGTLAKDGASGVAGPVRAGAYRWTLTGHAFDIAFSRKAE